MNVISLDAIVRNTLLRRRYPIHWYIDFIVYAKDALRILTTDDLHVVNWKKLPIDSATNSADLPEDFNGKVGVFVQVGQRLKPLVEDSSLNPMPDYDSSFQPKKFTTEPDLADQQLQYFVPFPFLMTTINRLGENVGRIFGGRSSMGVDTYRIVRERSQIQLNEALDADHIVLCYIGDGRDITSASNVDGMAQETIEAYIIWQMKENTRTYSDSEAERSKQEYIDERKILRARKDDLDLPTFARIIQRGTRAMK